MMLVLVLCNFRLHFGKLFFDKFAKFFSVSVRNIVSVAITATTATYKFGGEAAL